AEHGDGGVFDDDDDVTVEGDDVFVDDVTVEEQRRLELEQLELMMNILMEKDGCERRKIAPLIAMRNKLMKEMLVMKEEIKELERERKILEELRERTKRRKIRKEAKEEDCRHLFILFYSFSFFLFFSFLLVSTQVN
ncbi:hypothetical protein AABB24_010876, partial [Solanum stoloniferum]